MAPPYGLIGFLKNWPFHWSKLFLPARSMSDWSLRLTSVFSRVFTVSGLFLFQTFSLLSIKVFSFKGFLSFSSKLVLSCWSVSKFPFWGLVPVSSSGVVHLDIYVIQGGSLVAKHIYVGTGDILAYKHGRSLRYKRYQSTSFVSILLSACHRELPSRSISWVKLLLVAWEQLLSVRSLIVSLLLWNHNFLMIFNSWQADPILRLNYIGPSIH